MSDFKSEAVEAIQTGNIPRLHALLNQHPEKLEQNLGKWSCLDQREAMYGSLLHCAATFNQPTVIDFLVSHKRANVNLQINEKSSGLWTALHFAEAHEAYAAAAMLLDLDADPTVKHGADKDTVSFCQTPKVQNLRSTLLQEQRKQKKIAGIWAKTTPQEVVHDHELPDSGYRLTDIFNFETRSWRTVTKEVNGTALAHSVVFFDDMSDRNILYQALKKLKELGGDTDESFIDTMPLRGKSLLLKPRPQG